MLKMCKVHPLHFSKVPFNNEWILCVVCIIYLFVSKDLIKINFHRLGLFLSYKLRKDVHYIIVRKCNLMKLKLFMANQINVNELIPTWGNFIWHFTWEMKWASSRQKKKSFQMSMVIYFIFIFISLIF